MCKLVEYVAADSEILVEWLGDETVFYNWSVGKVGDYPPTAQKINDCYDRMKPCGFFAFMYKDGERPLGHVTMRCVDGKSDEMRLGFVVVASDMRGRGVGKRMLKEAISYAFENFHCKRLTIAVAENNLGAYMCYKSLGFSKVEGADENYFIGGRYIRCHVLVYNGK